MILTMKIQMLMFANLASMLAVHALDLQLRCALHVLMVISLEVKIKQLAFLDVSLENIWMVESVHYVCPIANS